MTQSTNRLTTAMILAAGKGTRMRPLTLNTPKPLLLAGGKSLIEWHIEKLVAAGFETIVINHSWLGEQLEQAIGNGDRWGVRVLWSKEEELLETGGGILQALPLLGDQPFLLINGDVFTDLNFSLLRLPQESLAHLVLVSNPDHNPEGDFALDSQYVAAEGEAVKGKSRYTFAGVSVLHPKLFENCKSGVFPLAPLLRENMALRRVTGELHQGYWLDVGTPERLQTLEKDLVAGVMNPGIKR